MKLETKKLSVEIDGVGYSLTYPTVSQIRVLEKEGDDINMDSVCSFVAACGMPKEKVEGLQADHLNAIVEALVGKSPS